MKKLFKCFLCVTLRRENAIRNFTIIFSFLIFNIFLFRLNALSQEASFDTLYTVVSSPLYDYRNPIFDDWLTTGIGFTDTWLVYEKHTASSSNIVAREITYNGYGGTEVLITNDNNILNINPYLSGGILVWQSNKNGNWDIYYSMRTNNVWSAPVLLDSTPANETVPCIASNRTSPPEYLYYYLVFKRNNNLIFKIYKNSTAQWGPDSNIAQSSYDIYSEPKVFSGASFWRLCYLKQINDSTKRIVFKRFTEANNINYVIWQATNEYYQTKSAENLNVSVLNIGVFLTYDYDTLGTIHTVAVTDANPRIILTKIQGGKNIGARGSTVVIPVENLSQNYFTISGFAFVRKSNDSTFVYAVKSYSDFGSTFYKKHYLGNANTVTKLNMSPPINNGTSRWKIRAVWEKLINNKTALVEAYMTDFFTVIKKLSGEIPLLFSLHQNFPNPFNPTTNIKFDIPKTGLVVLKVFDATGREIATLVNELLSAGTYETTLDGSELPSGIYFYRLATDKFSEIKKMIVIK